LECRLNESGDQINIMKVERDKIVDNLRSNIR
jgi:hypothetical protein